MEYSIKLNLIGITYNQIESGVYALILQEDAGSRRLPIIIGYPEAQAIECKLQDVSTPRPLTHDMMINALESFGLKVERVNIHTLPDGIFAADLVISDSLGNEVNIDSRSSDAIALAIRAGADIFTTPEVMDKAGFDPNHRKVASRPASGKVTVKTEQKAPEKASPDYAGMSDQRLEDLMQKAVENEDYIQAAEIKKVLDARKGI